MNEELNPGNAVSSIDGRYARYTKPLRNFFSEYALQKSRTEMEVEYLIFLSENMDVSHVRDLTDDEKTELRDLYKNFNQDSFSKIKKFERTTNHDVKSVEYFIKEELKETSLDDVLENIHFTLTSEDCTNIAYAQNVNKCLEEVYIPGLTSLVEKLTEMTERYADTPMLARTHGQPASPTTVGKEFGVFANELSRKLERLKSFRIPGKINNATGNYNALVATYPEIDGLDFSEQFLKQIGLDMKPYTTQVDGYTEYSELFDLFKETNTILKKLDLDDWLYISYNNFVQKRKEGEVGSSTMPHKVNPIRFENSEGNIRIANAIFEALNELPSSRMQRDLSGSTMLRSMGEAFGHTLISWKNTMNGLDRVEPNYDYLLDELDNHPEILAEPIQQVLRREGVAGAYEQMKEITRGRKVNISDFETFIEGLEVNANVKDELKDLLDPKAYVGQAPEIARQIAKDVRARLS